MEKFQFQYNIKVTDINYGGHLGNQKYLSIAHQVRYKFLKSIGFSEKYIGIPDVGMIMTEANIKFIKEIKIDDIIDIELTVTKISKIKFALQYNFYKNETLCAKINTMLCGFNYKFSKLEKLPIIFVNKLKLFSENE